MVESRVRNVRQVIMRISNNSVAMVEFITRRANARADEPLRRKVQTAFASASCASRVIQRRRASAGLGGNFRTGPDHDKGEPRSWLRSMYCR